MNKQTLLQIDISLERTMLLVVAERFIASLINTYGKNPISTDGRTWYLAQQACQFLKLKKSIICIPPWKKFDKKDYAVYKRQDRML